MLLYLGWLYGGGSLGSISFPLCCLVHFCQHHVSDELPVLGLVLPYQGHGGAHHLRHKEDGVAEKEKMSTPLCSALCEPYLPIKYVTLSLAVTEILDPNKHKVQFGLSWTPTSVM